MAEEKAVESTETNTESGAGEAEVEIKHSQEVLTRRNIELAAEAKKNRLLAQEYKKKITDIETEKMKETGKWKELAELKAGELEAIMKQKEVDRTTYARKVISGQIGQEALKLGCIDPKRLEILLPSLGIELDCDEDFNVKAESVKAALETAQKEMPYLFNKAAPKLKDAVPSKTVPTNTSDLASMSVMDRARLIATRQHKQ